jgi:hypothetical protein
MNEQEWLTATRPAPLYQHIGTLARKVERLRYLFNCACCRRAWGLLGESSRRFVEYAERRPDMVPLPDGSYPWEGEDKARGWQDEQPWPHRDQRACLAAASAALAVRSSSHTPADHASIAVARLSPREHFETAKAAEQLVQAELLRCIFGNPFQPQPPLAAALDWQGQTARRIAEAIYTELQFDSLPVLADALEDAGCDNEAILSHCRSSGPHARGCWVLAELLSKA